MNAKWLAALLPILSSLGCHQTPPPPAAQQATTSEHSVPAAWQGQWNGPEGTFLQLADSGDAYLVTIHDLDGSRTFHGVADHGRVRFLRDGKTEYLTAGNGEASGMKWLADKKDCLLTRPGEGWCRN